MYSVDVHPDVYTELEYSRAWYEERADNLGKAFLGQVVDRAIMTVRDSPRIWPFLDEDRRIRRYLVHRFPYGLVYRIIYHYYPDYCGDVSETSSRLLARES